MEKISRLNEVPTSQNVLLLTITGTSATSCKECGKNQVVTLNGHFFKIKKRGALNKERDLI